MSYEIPDDLPRLSVKIQQGDQEEVHEEPQDHDEVLEEVPDDQMEGVCSQEGEETQEQPGYSEEIERPELPYGNFIMFQFPVKEY